MPAETKSAFGEVLAELMEQRGFPADEEHVRYLATSAGIDPERFLTRVRSASAGYSGGLGRVAELLSLTGPEMTRLSAAYAWEERGAADEEARTFGVVELTSRDAEVDWRKLPHAEMLERVIIAVDGARSEAREMGDEHYVRYVEQVLFPFLEAELAKAKREEES